MNKIKYLGIKLISTVLLGLSLTACVNEGDDSPRLNQVIFKTINGQAIDGYISGAKVCLDINSNDICDSNEPYTTTQSDGSFSFNTTYTGNYPLIVSGGMDMATNTSFTGTLKNIVSLNDKNTTTNITPITTLSTNIYQNEIKINTNYTYTQAKQTTANNLGITIAQIEADPLKDKEVFIKSQQIIQTIKVLSKSIQKDESDISKNNEVFNHVMKQVSFSVKEDTTSNDLNISRLITKLESTTYEKININISSNIKSFVKNYSSEISLKVNNLNQITDLANIQSGFEIYTNDAKEIINTNDTTQLYTTLLNVKDNTADTLVQSGKSRRLSNSDIIEELANNGEVATISNLTTTVDENAISNTNIGKINVLDIGDSAITSYNISGVGSSNFDIDTNGNITVNNGANIDYETNTKYTLTVNAINNAGASNSAILIININNLSDTIPKLSNFTTSIDENISSGTIIGTVPIIINDGITSMILSGDGADKFDILATGVIALKVNQTLDYETKLSYILKVTAINGAGNSEVKDVNITLNHIAPVIITNSFSVNENQLNIGTILAVDDDNLTYSISSSDSDNININNSTGTITFKITPDYELKSSYAITISATDGTLNVDKNITINILDEDENAKGFLDLNFQNMGYITDKGSAFSIANDSLGNIYIAGSKNNTIFLKKYDKDGNIINSFGTDGEIIYINNTDISYKIKDIVIDENDNIYLLGTGMTIWKYLPSGELDISFGNNGIISFPKSQGIELSIYNIEHYNGYQIILNNNKIYTVGSIYEDSKWAMAIWRYTLSGELDTTFNEKGFVKYLNNYYNESGKALAIDSNNNIYISSNKVWKYKTSGIIDINFGNNGIANDSLARGKGYKILLDKNNNIFVSGYSYRDNDTNSKRMIILKYLPTGNLDTSFGDNGIIIQKYGVSTFQGVISDMYIDNYNRIITLGYSTSAGKKAIILSRYLPNGTLDTTFANDGKFAYYYAENMIIYKMYYNEYYIYIVGRTSDERIQYDSNKQDKETDKFILMRIK